MTWTVPGSSTITVPYSRPTASETPPGIVNAVFMVAAGPITVMLYGLRSPRRRPAGRRGVLEVGRRHHPDRRVGAAADLDRLGPGAAELLHGLQHRGRSDRPIARLDPDDQPLPLGRDRAGQDPQLIGPAAGLGQRCLATLRAGAELAQGPLQVGDVRSRGAVRGC